MDEIIEIFFHIVESVLIFTLVYLFWRNYRRLRDTRAAVLAIVFTVLFIYKILQVTLSTILGLSQFQWMSSHLATESLWIMVLASFIYVTLSSSAPGWRGRLQQKPIEPLGPRKAA